MPRLTAHNDKGAEQHWMNTRLLDWKKALAELGPGIGDRSAAYDSSDEFVGVNYAGMREAKLFSALVPAELGGGGVSYSEVCSMIRCLGRYCGSTALTYSMHAHLLSAALWGHRHGKPGEKLLRSVAGGEKVLVSTGATDWLYSNGTLQSCDGGYRFTGSKPFASGCLAGDLLITSGQHNDPVAGLQVLHFSVPLSAAGVRVNRVWQALGMRGTGSHTVVLENVFIPEQSVTLRRAYGEYHPVWNVVLTVALPLICAAYVGIAEAAVAIARGEAAKHPDDGVNSLLIGEMENDLTAAQIALDSMIANVNDLDVEPGIHQANRALIRKTLVSEAVRKTTGKALEACGGRGYLRALGLERLVRDAEAVRFHPMPEKKQQRFTGRLAMGLDPIAAQRPDRESGSA